MASPRLSQRPRVASALRTCDSRFIAGALLLAVGIAPAHAEHQLDVYGIVDMGLSKAEVGSTPGALLPGWNSNSETFTMKAGNTSRLGLRAQRDLGDDRYARFQLEHRFALDSGSASNNSVFWLGRSVVALGTKQWGELYAGREYSAAYAVALNADPTYWSYVSQLGAVYTYARYTPVASTVEATNIRWSNAVGFKSPTVAGFSGELQTALGEGTRPRATSANLQYKQGGLWIGAGWDSLDSSTNLKLLAGGYDFGVVFPKASYSEAKGGVNGDGKSYTVSAAVPLPFGRTFVSLGSYKPASGGDSSMIGTGVQYDLDKETLVYFNLGAAKRDGSSSTKAVDLGVKYTF